MLFVIDPRNYQASFDQMKGELARAEAAYKKTQLDVKRATPLAKQGAVSQKELDDSVQANEANKASVFAARANLDKAKLNLDWTVVKSPIDGVAGLANEQIGDLIGKHRVDHGVEGRSSRSCFPTARKCICGLPNAFDARWPIRAWMRGSFPIST